MKPLILITAYHPDDLRQKLLQNLVESTTNFTDLYDVGIISHTPIPEHISKLVSFSIYDSKNEILTDLNYRGRPWFSPSNRKIQSVFVGRSNTHLAVWRMMILGFSLAKNMGYEIVHHIEYDSFLNNVDELNKNTELLKTHDYIFYTESIPTIDSILFGSYQAYNLNTINPQLIVLNEQSIKESIKNSVHRSPEKMLKSIITEGKYIEKDRNLLNSNDFALSNEFKNELTKNNVIVSWCLPFYDQTDDKIHFVVWNTDSPTPLDIKIIINNTQIININDINQKAWSLRELGKINDINKILVMVNDKVRDVYDFNIISKKDFMISSFIEF